LIRFVDIAKKSEKIEESRWDFDIIMSSSTQINNFLTKNDLKSYELKPIDSKLLLIASLIDNNIDINSISSKICLDKSLYIDLIINLSNEVHFIILHCSKQYKQNDIVNLKNILKSYSYQKYKEKIDNLFLDNNNLNSKIERRYIFIRQNRVVLSPNFNYF
jgi:hypothetical protein